MPKLLLLSYYYPPSGGPGVQRALKFSRYLRGFGWEPTILTVRPERAAYPEMDPSLLAEVPDDLRVERTASWDPYALYARLLGKEKHETVSVSLGGTTDSPRERLSRWIRANLFLPDARVGWVPFAIARARRILAETPHDALFTTGPPHSTHLAGLWLARRTGLPWVADLRDPWTEIDYRAELPQSALAGRLDAALERRVLTRASAVTTVSPAMQENLARRVPREYHVLMNGFDPADFDGVEAPISGSHFVVSYAGNINAARSPDALWEALRRLDATRTMPALRIRFVGKIDAVVMERAEAAGVGDLVEVLPYRPHDEAVRLLKSSALLLLLINRVAGAEGIMTGKLFEYLASGRPVLGLGPVAGDAAAVLRETEAGALFDWDDAGGVASFLRTHYDAWRAGATRPGANPAHLAPYNRVEQARALAALLNRLTRP